jgi:uncharacterized tellurite resistance protein B-like protein
MPANFIERVRTLFEGDPAVRRVANDPALQAELLLLFRMILADGEVRERELEVFRRICRESFGIDGEGLESVLGYLKDFGYETSSGQAMLVFQEMPEERRRLLARHLAAIAKADADLSRQEVRFLARTLEMLGLQPDDVREPGT